MIKQRLLTIAVLIPFVVLVVVFLPLDGFAIILAIFLAVGIWEWSALIGIEKFILRGIYSSLLLLALFFSMHLTISWVLTLGVLWWLFALALLFSERLWNTFWSVSWVLRALVGLLVFIPPWLALLSLHHRPAYVLTILVLIWFADSGAFLVGKRLGKHRLAPRISPGKTLEGLLGGVLAGFIVGVLSAWILAIPTSQWIIYLFLVLGTLLISVVGDLFESRVKRYLGFKDSGHLLPGHGGMLDRIDSLLAAAPFFALGLFLMGMVKV